MSSVNSEGEICMKSWCAGVVLILFYGALLVELFFWVFFWVIGKACTWFSVRILSKYLDIKAMLTSYQVVIVTRFFSITSTHRNELMESEVTQHILDVNGGLNKGQNLATSESRTSKHKHLTHNSIIHFGIQCVIGVVHCTCSGWDTSHHTKFCCGKSWYSMHGLISWVSLTHIFHQWWYALWKLDTSWSENQIIPERSCTTTLTIS